jgi:hypothetical protein
MKKLSLLLLLSGLASIGVAADSGTLATAYQDGYEIELYNSGPECPAGYLGGAKFPEGARRQYILGCWVVRDAAVQIRFDDGTRLTLTRRQLVPRARSSQML